MQLTTLTYYKSVKGHSGVPNTKTRTHKSTSAPKKSEKIHVLEKDNSIVICHFIYIKRGEDKV